MTEAEMYVLWSYAREAWPNYPLPEPGSDAEQMRATVWMDEFADVPAAAVRDALRSPELAEREWFPPLGLIRSRALAAVAAIGGIEAAPDLDVAWREVQQAVRRTGMGGVPVWSHPVVAETVGSVGWRNLCMADEGDAGTFRQFREFYALAAARQRAAIAPGPTLALDGSGHPRGLGSGQPD